MISNPTLSPKWEMKAILHLAYFFVAVVSSLSEAIDEFWLLFSISSQIPLVTFHDAFSEIETFRRL